VVSKVVPFKREGVEGKIEKSFNICIGKYEEVLVSQVVTSAPVLVS
jgi:hypothetical protein